MSKIPPKSRVNKRREKEPFALASFFRELEAKERAAKEPSGSPKRKRSKGTTKTSKPSKGSSKPHKRSKKSKRTYRVTVYPSRFAVDEPASEDLSWSELVDACIDEEGRQVIAPEEKDSLPIWHGARIREGGGRRNADVESVSCLFLDIDKGGLVNGLAALKRREIRAIAFASPSGRKGRGRVIVPLSRDVTPAEYQAVWTIVNGWMGGIVDKQTRSPSHGYYTPAIVEGKKFWSERLKGSLLDVDEMDLVVPEDEVPVMRAPRADELEQLDLRWREAQVRECVDQLVHKGDIPEGNRHGALFRICQRCLDFSLPEDMTEKIVLDVNRRHCNPPEDEAVVRQAVLANPAKYRRHPVGCELTICVKMIETDHARTLQRVIEVLADRCPNLYTRGGVLVELCGSRFKELTKPRLSTLVSTYVRLYKFDKGNKDEPPSWVRTSINDDHWICKELLALPSFSPVREAAGITDIPVLRPDGSILAAEGYDEATQLVYIGEPMENVPRSPTYDEGLAALERIEEVFSQTPFADETRRSAFFSLLLSTVGRLMIDGPVPIGIVNAKMSQVGKSALAEAIAIIYTGEIFPVTTWPAKYKMNETLHTAMVSDPRLLVFDNLETSSKVVSHVLDGAVTSMKIWRRRLYQQVRWSVDFRPVVCLTGNNLSIGGDMKKRALHIFLQSEFDTSERTDLKIPDFIRYMHERRLEIVRNLLTVWRAFLAVPSSERGEEPKPWKTFTQWTVVRQLLLWYGRSDPRGARADDIDDDTEMQTMLLGYLRKKWPRKKNGLTATDLCSRLDKFPIAGVGRTLLTDEEQQLKSWIEETAGVIEPRKVGIRVLGALKDRVHESGYILVQREIRLRKRVKKKNGTAVWRADKGVKGSKRRYFVLTLDEYEKEKQRKE